MQMISTEVLIYQDFSLTLICYHEHDEMTSKLGTRAYLMMEPVPGMLAYTCTCI